MAQDNDISADMDFDSQNIFDEFSDSEEIAQEVKQIEEKEKKDIYYYVKNLNTFLFVVNILIFLSICISAVYIYIQSGENKKAYNFLSPICGVFLWDVSQESGRCYGVTPILKEKKDLLSSQKTLQAESIIELLGEVYSIENFNLSKKVSFLLDKTQTRVKPLEILANFDAIKTSFAPTDKWELSCYDIKITSDSIMEVTCDAYSSDWDTQIVGLDKWSVSYITGWGTSISRASSFISFIENSTDSPFVVVEKPSALNSEEIQLGPYTQKTTMKLKLQYSSIEALSY